MSGLRQRQSIRAVVLSPQFRCLFEQAYQAWFEGLERASWKGVPEADWSGDDLFRELVRLLPDQERLEGRTDQAA